MEEMKFLEIIFTWKLAFERSFSSGVVCYHNLGKGGKKRKDYWFRQENVFPLAPPTSNPKMKSLFTCLKTFSEFFIVSAFFNYCTTFFFHDKQLIIKFYDLFISLVSFVKLFHLVT